MLRIVVITGLLLVAGGYAPGQEASPPAEQASSPADAKLEALRTAAAADPENELLRRQLAIALHGAKQREEAIDHFEWLAKRSPTERSLLDLALAYASVSRFDETEATYARLLELSPNHPITLHNLGNLAYTKGETDKAIDLYGKAIAAKPDYLLAYAHLGDALAQAERYQEAYRTYEKALQLEPTSAAELAAYDDSLYGMASLDITMGAYERAGQLLAELLQANPEHPSAYYAYGQVLMHLGRVEEAQRAFEAHQRVLAKQTPKGPMAHGD
jgi:tetratricopeptide (TPR) repeat protein